MKTNDKMPVKHTPGPWEIDSELPPNPRPVIARAGNIPISAAHCGPHDPCEDANNARLIAAAPELLAACMQAADAIPATHGAAKTIRAAIAKAIGKP